MTTLSFRFYRRSFAGLLLALALTFVSLAEASASPTVQYLRHGGPALAQLLDEIDRAEHSIDMMYYIFKPCDSSTRLIIERLHRVAWKHHNAGNKNFRIRLLLDAIPQRNITQELSVALGQRGIEVRFFNTGSVLGFSNRNHVKFTLIDGKRLVTGGRNLTDAYFGLADVSKGDAWYDKDIFVSGGAAPQQALAVFDDYWKRMGSRIGIAKSADEIGHWSQKCLTVTEEEKRIVSRLSRERNRDKSAHPAVRCDQVDFIADELFFNSLAEFEKGGDGNVSYQSKRSTKAVVDFLNDVRTRLVGENYVLQPTYRLWAAFDGVKKRGVDVLFVTNKSLDFAPLTRLTQHYSRLLHGDNFQVRWFAGNAPSGEYWYLKRNQSKYRLHSKVLTADGRDAIVGSFNMDGRSYNRNYESVLKVQSCPNFTAQVERDIRLTADHSEMPTPAEGIDPQLAIDLMMQDEY